MGEGKKNALRVTRMEKIMLCKHLYGNVSLKRGIKLHSKQFFSMTFSLMFIILPSLSTAGTISGERKVWHKLTIDFKGPVVSETDTDNPFMNYRLNVTFAGPTGRKLLVPGYFAADGDPANTSADSGNIWRVHLAPDKEGTWNYSVSFRRGTNIAVSDDPTGGDSAEYMDGQTGRFKIGPTDKTGRDFRAKGRLDYVGKHHLQFKGTGEYFLKCGADAPENFLAYADFDGPFKSDGIKDKRIKNWSPHVSDWKTGDPTWSSLDGKLRTYGKGIIGAINYLHNKGMNVFSFIPMNIEGDDRNVFPYLNYDERYRLDVSRLAQWEIVFEHADKLGMYLHFKTQETENELLLDGGDMGLQRKLYYRELIARFSHHLALNWNLGEEINDASKEQKQAWAEYFWTHDPYQHHIVIHNGADHHELMGDPPDGSCLTGFSLQTNKVTFVNVHNRTKNYINRSINAGKPWVVACDEPGDAQHALIPDSDVSRWDPERKNARGNALWGNVMAGGAGLEFYFGYKHDHSDLTCQDFRSRDLFWDQGKFMLDFFKNNKIPFWEMSNENSLISAADGYCLRKPGEVYVVYLKTSSSTNITLPEGKFTIRWYNPRVGGRLQSTDITSLTGPGDVWIGNPPEDPKKDWVVLIKPKVLEQVS